MIIGANLRFGGSGGTTNGTRTFNCPASSSTEASLLYLIAVLGVVTNVAVMLLILGRATLRRWSQGLILHQAAVDCTRATMLLPLALSHHFCRPVAQCSIFETVFLLLATVSAVNLLTTVLNDTPLMPDDDGIDIDWLVNSPDTSHWLQDDDEDQENPTKHPAAAADGGFSANVGARLLDAPHCVLFGITMIWFAAITVNLGPTFITGALANHVETTPLHPACPLIQTPYRHYIVNLLWVIVNSLCLILTVTHLYRLHRDLIRSRKQAVRVTGVVATIAGPAVAGNTDDNSNFHKLLRRLECEGLQRIRMFTTICIVYALFWGPLFLVVAFGSRASEEGRGLASVGPPKDPASHQVTLYICFAHAFINPTVFLLLHSGLREAACAVLSCCFGRDCRSGHHSPDPSSGHYGDGRAGSFDHRSHHLQPQRRPPATLTGLVDYDRIINFNGGPSFLSPVHTFSPTLAAPSSSAVADSRPMETVI
ncbi:uncharacterized protein LOC116930242 isoform X1 [Daphnia magna]|nr:uncharacterized protein LOC116930242 isoform X1 [Daphnia magna]